MLSNLRENRESYYFHLTRESFNTVAERLGYSLMKLLDGSPTPDTMPIPPPCRGDDFWGTAMLGKFGASEVKPASIAQVDASNESNVDDDMQCSKDLERKMRPHQVAEYFAVRERKTRGSGQATQSATTILDSRSSQLDSALDGPAENSTKTSKKSQLSEQYPTLPQSSMISPPQSLMKDSMQSLTQRLQPIRPPQSTRQSRRAAMADIFGPNNIIVRFPPSKEAQNHLNQPRTTPKISRHESVAVFLMLLSHALWFFLKVFLGLTYKIIVSIAMSLASKIAQVFDVPLDEMTPKIEQWLQSLGEQVKTTIQEVLDRE